MSNYTKSTQRFACYAVEHFDGTPTDYNVCFYDGHEVPPINLEDPNVSIDIHLEGKLSNPFDRSQLCDWCDDHDLELIDDAPNLVEDYPFSDYNEPEKYNEFVEPDYEDLQFAFVDEDEPYEEEDESEIATEDLKSATEGPISWARNKKAQKNRRKIGLDSDAYEQEYQTNLDSLQSIFDSGTRKKTNMSDVDIAEYYSRLIGEQEISVDDKQNHLFVYYGNKAQVLVADASAKLLKDIDGLVSDVKKFDTANANDAAVSNKITKWANQLGEKVRNQIVSAVKKVKLGEVYGYWITDVQSGTNKANDLTKALGKDATANATDAGATQMRGGALGRDVEGWDNKWAKMDGAQRRGLMNNIAKKVSIDNKLSDQFVREDRPWSTTMGKIVHYSYTSNKTETPAKIDAGVLTFLTKNKEAQNLIFDRKVDEPLEGLDFSDQAQFAAIQTALSLDNQIGWRKPIDYLYFIKKQDKKKEVSQFIDEGIKQSIKSFSELLTDGTSKWRDRKEMVQINREVFSRVSGLIKDRVDVKPVDTDTDKGNQNSSNNNATGSGKGNQPIKIPRDMGEFLSQVISEIQDPANKGKSPLLETAMSRSKYPYAQATYNKVIQALQTVGATNNTNSNNSNSSATSSGGPTNP